MFLRAAVKFLIIVSALAVCTFIYSLFENRPPKIVAYFIATFGISLIMGIVILFIGRLFSAQQKSFLNDPYRIILVLVLAIGMAKILGASAASKQANALVLANPESDAETKMRHFESSEFGVSFDYPSNWSLQTPQKQSTVVLLYESNGSLATCNLSIIPQDQQRIENYNESYFKNNLSKVYESFENVETQFLTLNGKKLSITKYDFLLPTKSDASLGQCVTLTSLHRGQRLMLIVNVPKARARAIEDDLRVITETLNFW